jgi:restriction endonuclease Mrr
VAGNYQNAAIYYNKLPANFPAIQELLQVSRIIDNGLKVNWGTAALWLYIKQTCLTNLQNQWVQTHGEIAPEILQNPKQLKDTIQSMDLQLENCTDDCRLAAYLTLHNAPLHSNGGELTFQSAYEFVYHTVKKIDNDIDKLDAVLNEKIEDVPCEIQGTSIDQLNGYEFEKLLGDLFRALGYHSSVTKASGDQGIDIIAEKDDIKIGVQAKCYTGPVGNGAVQEAIAGIRFYNLDKGFVVTNSYFTPSAKELAKSARIVLWDRDILMSKLKEAHLI